MTQEFNGKQIRAKFPFLSREVNEKPIIYLDSAASSQKPQQVLDKLLTTYSHGYANIHRGLHTLSEEATDAYEEVRSKIARFINAADKDEVIFTSGATMSLNLIANCYGLQNLKSGDEILITVAEHHANIIPWQMLCQKTGAKIVAVPVDDDGCFNITELKDRVTKNTKIISVPHVSNVLGTIFPVKEISAIAHENNAICVVDGCQGVIHMPVDIQDIDCDFYVFSGHKLYGPSGIGICWGKAEILADMPPFLGGGDMIDDVEIDSATYSQPPSRFEAGTPPIAECIALGAAVDFVTDIGMDKIASHEKSLLLYGHQRLASVKGLSFVGTSPNKSGVISFTLDAAHPHDISTLIDQDGIAIRAGHHCAQPLMKFLNLSSTARASIAVYSEPEDFDALAISLEKVNRIFGA
ncbi:MAG: Cysteine desulfurase SufS [SAR116 cluster bacterium]|jgi:cysteine desulfurase/selenocysteine lyase|nr:cysteine desulfurase [Alphaproteobacteria bacterium]CAI8360115.1 MAG: Cysteine desulfurase SufS [SAR116 cluster bacterium]